jgi:hypothetical protein
MRRQNGGLNVVESRRVDLAEQLHRMLRHTDQQRSTSHSQDGHRCRLPEGLTRKHLKPVPAAARSPRRMSRPGMPAGINRYAAR